MNSYPVVLRRDDNDTILVSFPDLPRIHTFGNDRAAALRHAVAALESGLIALMTGGQDIPRPSPVRGRPSVSLPPLSAAKVALYHAMQEAGVSKAALARRLKCHPPQVDRLLDLRHASRLDRLSEAFDVLGKRLVVEIRNAA